MEEYNFYREKVKKLEMEMFELDDKINNASSKFDNYSKAVSDTSSVSNFKTAIQNLNVNFFYLC